MDSCISTMRALSALFFQPTFGADWEDTCYVSSMAFDSGVCEFAYIEAWKIQSLDWQTISFRSYFKKVYRTIPGSCHVNCFRTCVRGFTHYTVTCIRSQHQTSAYLKTIGTIYTHVLQTIWNFILNRREPRYLWECFGTGSSSAGFINLGLAELFFIWQTDWATDQGSCFF